MEISIVIPAYNEEANIPVLYEQITSVMDKLKESYEIIFVDDGSTDKTFENLMRLRENDTNLKIIKFRKNFGQTAALDAGFKHSKADIIISMDSDLQNDPADIPNLLQTLRDGNDVVCGWRYNRKDTFSKRIISRGAHFLRKIIIRDNIHDSGCTLRAYKKECFNDFDIYGDMHRFIPAILFSKGFKIVEIKVKHMPRVHGETKYNISRVIKGILDMFIVRFWTGYSSRPLHLFGSLGIVISIIGFFIDLYLTAIKLLFGQPIADRPLLLLGVMLVVLGFQIFIFGVLADIMIKVYYQGDKKNYSIEEII